MPPRRRTRGRSRASSLVIFVFALLVVTGSVPVTSFTTGALDRSSTITITADEYADYGMNVTTKLQEGNSNCLVEVTNRLGTDVTAEVTLRSDSRALGDLKNPDDLLNSGDSVSFSLANGETKTVKMDVASGTNTSTVYFYVNASSPGFDAVVADRNAPIGSSSDNIDLSCI